MTAAVPAEALGVLDEGVLCHLAASTAAGPHLTPVVYAVDGGRLWITTARHSVKATAWRRDPGTAGLIRAGARAVAFRGRVRTYDALDLSSWPGAAASAPRLASAAARFSLRNARFFAGYAVDARRVPFSWSPPGRVFAEIRLEAGRLLDLEEGEVVAAWGPWHEGTRYRSAFAPLPRAPGLDRRVPKEVREGLGERGDATLALEGEGGLVALPIAWRRVATEGAHEGRLPESIARLAGGRGSAPAAMTVDHASTWRASAMKGMSLQGTAELFSPAETTRGRRALGARVGPGEVLARLRPVRIVWWDGWSSGTVRAR